MQIFYLLFLLCWCLWTCQSKIDTKQIEEQATEPTPIELKKALWEKLSLFSSMKKLKSAIRNAEITEREVMDFCRENEDMATRAKLIQAVFSDNEYDEEAPKAEYWAAHRLNVAKFVEIVSILREGRETFMDIGSGNGEKLFGALCLGFKKAYGLEYSPNSFQMSKLHLKKFLAEVELTQGDALKVPFSFYQKADFLYMYSPIKDDNLMASLFKRIMENMKEDAVLLEVRFVYAEALRKISSYDFPPIRGWLAIKKQYGRYFYKNIAENAYGYDLLDGRAWLELNTR